MAELRVDIAEIKKLAELVETHHLEELTVGEGDLSITVKGPVAQSQPQMLAYTAAQPVQAESSARIEEETTDAGAEETAELEGNIVDIVAPLVGVFYRAPSPDASAFVEEGDVIEVGTEIGLIEAMKVFSQIPSEVAGTVVAIPATNGKLVQEGEVLVRVRVSEDA